jgi:hypothetical protein
VTLFLLTHLENDTCDTIIKKTFCGIFLINSSKYYILNLRKHFFFLTLTYDENSLFFLISNDVDVKLTCTVYFHGHAKQLYLLCISKIEIKYKVNVDKDNFLHFQCIECTNFKTEFFYLCA